MKILSFFTNSQAYHSFFINTLNELFAFGKNEHGQLSNGNVEDQPKPVKINLFVSKDPFYSIDPGQCISISCGYRQTLFCTSENVVFGAGSNIRGEIGLGQIELDDDKTATAMLVRSLVGKKITKVFSGGSHSFFIAENYCVYACGYGEDGQLGDGEQKDRFYPVKVKISPMERISTISAGYNISVFLSEKSGKLFYTGQSRRSTGDSSVPTLISAFKNEKIISVDTGYSHCVCVSQSGKVYGFGSNNNMQLGGAGVGSISVPYVSKVLSGKGIYMIKCGYYHSLGLSRDGKLWGFGSNASNELGLKDKDGKDREAIIIKKNVLEMFGGVNHTFLFTKDRKCYAAGDNGSSQLGFAQKDEGVTKQMQYVKNVFNVKLYPKKNLSSLAKGIKSKLENLNYVDVLIITSSAF